MLRGKLCHLLGMCVRPANSTMKCNSVSKGGILVIDDDPATLADLTRILSMGGYTCHCCRDVDSAISQFHETPPRLVIADLGLVGPNGYRWNEALSREIGHVDVPLMFLSNAQHPDIIHRHSDSGGAYYLRKPIEVVVLLELVDKALWTRRLAGARALEPQGTRGSTWCAPPAHDLATLLFGQWKQLWVIQLGLSIQFNILNQTDRVTRLVLPQGESSVSHWPTDWT